MDLREIENVNPWTHWYYQSKASAVKELLSPRFGDISRVADIGAGSSFFSQYLSQHMPDTHFTCVDTSYSKIFERVSPNLELRQTYEGQKANLYIFMDVLEHVESDAKLLRDYLETAEIGTSVLITVPAFMSLWSEHDVFLGHFRRYRRQEVISLAERMGLEVQSSHYLFSSFLPVIYLMRKLGYRKSKGSNMAEVSKPINYLLQKIHNLEHKFIKNPFFGLSVILYATKSS